MGGSEHLSLSPALYDEYFASLISGNRAKCHAIVEELIAGEMPLKSVYLQLFERSMYQVGALWETNRISVAVEHLATSITESAMGLFYPTLFSSEHSGHKTIVSCVANEYHQVGGKMVADLFEFHGWDSFFLGANTPASELLRMIGEKDPDLLCLSLAIYSNMPELLGHLDLFQKNYPALKVVVGGQAFRLGGTDYLQSRVNVVHIKSLDELETLIESYNEPGS